MIITKTPFRMSFFGGGTDYEGFFKENGGSVISSTFDKYCMVSVGHLPRFFDYSNQLTYSRIERTKTVDEIEHPAVRNAMKYLDMHELRIDYEADLPARSGLGTSSSFAVGLLSAFYALKGRYVDKRKLADDAIYLERILCGESGGIQDQIAAAFGGLNRIDFYDGGYNVCPIIISSERKRMLNDSLMLFFTGFSRFSSEIASVQEKSIKANFSELKEMQNLVDEAYKVLVSNETSLNEFGLLLDYTWKLKRGLTKAISNESIDSIYKKALDAGALGGKLLGAGGGGFILLYVEKEKQAHVRKVLKDLLYIPFKFENEGTKVIYFQAEDYNRKEAND